MISMRMSVGFEPFRETFTHAITQRRDLQPSAHENYSTFKTHQVLHFCACTQHKGLCLVPHSIQSCKLATFARLHGRGQQSSRDSGGAAQLRQHFDRFLQCQGALCAWKRLDKQKQRLKKLGETRKEKRNDQVRLDLTEVDETR